MRQDPVQRKRSVDGASGIRRRRWLLGLIFLAGCASAGGRVDAQPEPSDRWWKGNLHTHSLWSDGGDYPEMIAAWYRDHGYNFVAFTEHDMLQEGERWLDINAPDDGWPPRNESARKALPGYREMLGTDWVEEHEDGTRHMVRLRPLSEHRHLVEEPGRFLLLMGEEITDREGAHVNAIEPGRALLPLGGDGPAERIRNNLGAVAEHEREVGRRVLAIVNHPNYVWSLTAEEIAGVTDARFFEVYNGHSLVNNDGDAERASTERIWDVALSLRLSSGGPLLYGLANDDAHDYRPYSSDISRPGRGWIHARAERLAAVDLVAAIDAGDFYASTGVTLRDVRCTGGSLRVEIEPEPNVDYRTIFIGTRRAADLSGRPVATATGDTLRTTLEYGPDVGQVLAEVEGTAAEYVFSGDELYVRARVVSSRPHVDPTTGAVLGVERAWVQPVVPPRLPGGDCGGS